MSNGGKGPGYTVKDLFYYSGLFGGIILVYFALQPFAVHPLFRLIGGVAVGVGLGWLLETVYVKSNQPPNPRDPDDYPHDYPP